MNLIRSWHLDQAARTDPLVVSLHVGITAGGRVYSTGLGIEPEHIHILLVQLREAGERLAQFGAQQKRRLAKVINLPSRE